MKLAVGCSLENWFFLFLDLAQKLFEVLALGPGNLTFWSKIGRGGRVELRSEFEVELNLKLSTGGLP